MRRTPATLPLLLAALSIACSEKSDDTATNTTTSTGTSGAGTGGGGGGTSGATSGGLAAEEAFDVPERAWDLAIAPDDLVYATAQGGGKIYTWDPSNDDRDELTDEVAGVRGIAFDGDQPWVTVTAEGVTGSLSRLDGRFAEEVHTQADDGTLFRDPIDFIATGGGWLIADHEAPGLFTVSASGAVTFADAGSTAPNALVESGGTVTIAGDDGIWQIAWPGGAAELVDERAAGGLIAVDGAIWAANSSDGIFEVGGSTQGGSEIARAGSMARAGDTLYVADQVGPTVWQIALAR